ncbi:MAG: bifunctional homocysteine S-methyltransferase/methylenetetrahydrofolate reductase [Anaerolineae bacterium]|jgi:homocysteine S-methyltransferase|nr:bifunctional homocysteine S-methyltransferase/methylenetetrahydrofolate reductase [Anaerolineae bacterium]
MRNEQSRFLHRIKEDRPLLVDGAMGTMLYQRGFHQEDCLESLNLSHPDKVLQVHREYVLAGAELLLANTFGANRYRLAHYHMQDQLKAINEAGVTLARQAAAEAFDRTVLIAGDVGPLGLQLAPYGRVKQQEAYAAFAEQIEILANAKVDVLMLETHTNLKELLQGVRAAKEIAPHIPVVASMTYLRDDKTAMGNTPREVAVALQESGADVLGANCSGGPNQLQRILLEMRKVVPEAIYCIMPNAGWPERSGGRIIYPDATAYFAEQAVQFWINGANIIGGCCGTTAAHISAMRAALNTVPSKRHVIEVTLPKLSDEEETEPNAFHRPSKLEQKLNDGQFVITVEVSPPHGHATHDIEAAVSYYKDCGIDAIDVTDSPMARMRMSPWAVSDTIHDKFGVETILHFPVRGRNLLRVQGDLLAAHRIGIRNVFVVMGDPTKVGDYPEAMDDYDLVPSGLIKMLAQQFNRGVDFSGKKFSEPTSFFIGGALNLNPENIDREIRVTHRKIEAGVNFFLTQPVFDLDKVLLFKQAYQAVHGPLTIPVIAGLMPIRDAKHAAFLHNEIPGIMIPKEMLERINQAGDKASQVGLDIVTEMGVALKPHVQGIYLMPFRRHQAAGKIIDAIRKA